MSSSSTVPNLPASGAFPHLPATRQPERALLTYYWLTSLVAGPFFLFVLIPMFFRYHTMRYLVDEEGITMRWGVLFRREVSLTFARIQDIHLSSNFLERWLGIAKIQVQTASGSSSAEMTIEGLHDYDAVRDFLYARMRGAKDLPGEEAHAQALTGADPMRELTATLSAIAAEVRALREALPARRSEGESDA